MTDQKDIGPNLVARYNAQSRRSILIILASIVLILVLGIFFATLGQTDTTVSQCWITIWQTLRGQELDTAQKVVLHFRLPRIAMAILAGTGLSVSGAAMLVYLVSLSVGMSPESLVLTGIAINYLFSAATSVIQYFADEHQLSAAVDWAFGSFNGATWEQVGVVALCVALCFAALFIASPSLNVLSCGNDEVSRSIGIDPTRTRVWVGVFSVFATAAVISFSSVIGFVGLAGPHIARMLIGSDHRYLLPFSAASGAIPLLAADTIGRLILAPVLIPVGIVVSFLGVPIFVNLILTRKRRAMG